MVGCWGYCCMDGYQAQALYAMIDRWVDVGVCLNTHVYPHLQPHGSLFLGRQLLLRRLQLRAQVFRLA
jgi:hypothetical protein